MSDLIFRENVLKNFEDMCEDCFAYTREKKEVICRRCFIQTVKDIIKKSPSVKQERKKGEWVVHDYALGKERYECAECKGRCDLEYNFCPNCGADMLSGEEKDE